MAIRDELHALVDHLSDDAVAAALAYVRRLAQEPQDSAQTARDRLAQRMGPSAVSGAAFFSQASSDLATLAAQQGVRPVARFDDLLTDIWPESEDVDEFIATLRCWRRDRDEGNGNRA